MRKVGDIVQEQKFSVKAPGKPLAVQAMTTTTTGSKPRIPRLPDAQIAQLFVRLHGIYGQLWANRFSSRDMYQATLLEWAVVLYPFTQAHIDEAVGVCRREYRDFPPSLGAFEGICKVIKRREMQLAEWNRRLPPPPKPAYEKVVRWLGEMRRAIVG